MRNLDVGAGGGEFLAAARQSGFEVEGVEPSVGYARYATKAYGITVHAAQLAEVDFGDRNFDLITRNHSLEHMRGPVAALRRLHALLKPDGYLYLSVPDLGDERLWPIRFFHAGHCYGFTHETLVMMAAKAGFAPLDNELVGGTTTLMFRRLPEPDPQLVQVSGISRPGRGEMAAAHNTTVHARPCILSVNAEPHRLFLTRSPLYDPKVDNVKK